MDHGQYGPLEFSSAAPKFDFLPSEVPFYMHQVQPPNAPPPPLMMLSSTVSPPSPFPHTWDDFYGGGRSGNHGTSSSAVSTTIRWPRQETLALLEIRSKLDPYFKEATSSNHKSPLWDEVSRIMEEEHGYRRSGRKCKEKFENLYKYYKKTKEGKIGKHDGKHYRFFRQLEALYGGQSNTQLASIPSNYHHQSSNANVVYPCTQSHHSSEFETPSPEKKTSTSDYEGWIATMVEPHLAKLMDKQDEWGAKILSTIENNEKERICKEEEWRKQELARLDQEYKTWTTHVARVEARDKTVLEVLKNCVTVKSIGSCLQAFNACSTSGNPGDWIGPEISSLNWGTQSNKIRM